LGSGPLLKLLQGTLGVTQDGAFRAKTRWQHSTHKKNRGFIARVQGKSRLALSTVGGPESGFGKIHGWVVAPS